MVVNVVWYEFMLFIVMNKKLKVMFLEYLVLRLDIVGLMELV